MRHFFDWFAEQVRADERWLILGKGPTFERRAEFDLTPYRLLSLNHVVRELAVAAAHIIDVDVVNACAEALVSNAQVVVMPWYPHVDNRAGDRPLEAWVREHPVLAELDRLGRLLWYDLATSARRHGDRPVVQATFFSAEAALSLLALAGARTVRSLGVDGGSTYSKAFDDLKSVTLLANTVSSFDRQFETIARILQTTGVDFAPLTVAAPIRVFVGSEEPQMLAVKVLEYSIRRHASMTVEVAPLHRSGVRFATPRDPRNRPRTPFSFQRFAIPALVGHRGRAIYLDSDMLVFGDIRELWMQPFDGADLLAVREPADTGRLPQFSVMVLDCERLRWTPEAVIDALDSGRLDYEQVMFEMALAQKVAAAIDPAWNSLERFEKDRTRLLHYTDMDRQPWVSLVNPNGRLWVRVLLQAIDDGFLTREFVAEHVKQGWVRPSLLSQIDRRDSRLSGFVRWRAARADRRFVAPYRAQTS